MISRRTPFFLHRWHTALQPHWQRLQPEAGWAAQGPWLVAALALLAAAGLAGVAQPAWQRQAQADDAQTLRLLQQVRHRASQSAQIIRWTDTLPSTQQHETRVADLMEAALRNTVTVVAVEQGSPGAPVPRLRLQRIDLTARAPYADLRRFIEAALQADTGLALQRVTLSRANGDAVELDARLQFSLMERVEAAKGAETAQHEAQTRAAMSAMPRSTATPRPAP